MQVDTYYNVKSSALVSRGDERQAARVAEAGAGRVEVQPLQLLVEYLRVRIRVEVGGDSTDGRGVGGRATEEHVAHLRGGSSERERRRELLAVVQRGHRRDRRALIQHFGRDPRRLRSEVQSAVVEHSELRRLLL
jgi:hypothetical protein